MANISESTYNLIKNGLNASSLRGEIISNNISNINTANFKRSYVSFEDQFKKSSSELSLKVTKNKHITDNKASGTAKVLKDESTSMRTDGNNVDLELEKTNQAANTMLYNALVTSANGKISNLRYVITGGGK
ncbi:flagellar basal body rod protein FlgB [Clostridium intestinale]|uniref:Flagellar basal body rod protein FlgB n=1 Tax=Clostridium intestinale TaxID=36845 RepID=A0A7D6VPI0_9CLOT|nr:flagellar basal body rod protein FlgB [Clostridium intestinale]QLY78749.1 flagellar basal body rod protein FlgB [Clostridium intestinale]